MAAITVKTNSKQFIKELKKHRGGLASASADTVNRGAEFVQREYKKNLKRNFILRNKYTLNAPKLFKSKPQSKRTGDFRPLKDINALVFIRDQKGGKKHYLLDQEEGGIKRGSSLTDRKVAIPLDASRKGETIMGVIGGRYKLFGKLFQKITVGGKPFGVNDGFTPAQRWAIANRVVKGTKMFIMETARGLSVFGRKGQKGDIYNRRSLKKTIVKIKALHLFDKAFKKLTPAKMEDNFNRSASRYVRNK